MKTRRDILTGIAIASGAYAIGSFRESDVQSKLRLFGQGSLMTTNAGLLEYAIAGDGPPCMMIHGTGGGFDQGLLFASALRQSGYQIIAPSRFGYLGSAFPNDASPAHQADIFIDLLDHLKLDRIPVIGGSAGALTAAEFALRHPDRCSHLVLLVPAANLTNKDPVTFTRFQRAAVNVVLGSDWWFWTATQLAPKQILKTLLATDPTLLDSVSPDEQQRARAILAQLFPISRKADGVRSDGFWAGTPSPIAFERIEVPTLTISCEDDLFGTAATARLLSKRIPDCQLTIYPSGGHIWLGHDADVAKAISKFIKDANDDKT